MAKKLLRSLGIVALFSFSIAGVKGADVTWTNGSTVKPTSAFFGDGTSQLYIDGTVTVSENVLVSAAGGDVVINVGAAASPTNPVILQPYSNSTDVNNTNGHTFGNLILYAPKGKTITIMVPAGMDLRFVNNLLEEMNVTFSGDGQIIFKIGGYDVQNTMGQAAPMGKVIFGGGEDSQSLGTNVFIMMDQEGSAADPSSCTPPHNKVVFERMDYDSTYSGWPIIIVLGPSSNWIYLSTDMTKVASNSYAAVALDPSNNGYGPFVFQILQRAALVLAGHYIESFSLGQHQDIRNLIWYNYAAGQKAILRVIDDAAKVYFESKGLRYAYMPTDATRRGVTWVNVNQYDAMLASDPYYNYYLWSTNYYWYKSTFPWYRPARSGNQNVRLGFVVGHNGWFDIYNNRYAHYISGSPNYVNTKAFDGLYYYYGSGGLGPSAWFYLKHKTPSALIVDGIDYGAADWYQYQWGHYYYPAHPTYYPYPRGSHALVTFRGDGRLHMSAAQYDRAWHYPDLPNDFWPIWRDFGDGHGLQQYFYYSGIAGYGYYNGDCLPLYGGTPNADEGQHVLEVEGEVDVRSLDCSPNVGEVAKGGVINIAPLQLNFKGEEIDVWTGRVYKNYRPLAHGAAYQAYRSASMFFNDHANFYDVTIDHNDVLKCVTPRPVTAEPAIVGGERRFYWWWLFGTNYEFPELRLFNSTLKLHESLACSGVRWVVKENYGADLATARDNNSSFIFYNHGDKHDMNYRGYGRIFMLGCMKNLFAANNTNQTSESAFVNIFRGRDLPLDCAGEPVNKDIQLSLLTADQLPLVKALGNKTEATHLFLFTQGSFGVGNMSLGWTTSRGWDTPRTDLGGAKWPWNLATPPNSGVDIDALTTHDFEGQTRNGVSPATLSIGGSPGNLIYFGSKKYVSPCEELEKTPYIPNECKGGLDRSGQGSPLGYSYAPYANPYYGCLNVPRDIFDHNTRYNVRFPVVNSWSNPVCYVNHGGKVTITDTNDCIWDTVIAPKLWYDYRSIGWASTPESERVHKLSGIVDLPHDQVKFTQRGSVQPYAWGPAITEMMRIGGGGNILRVKGYQSERTATFDKASNEEVTIPWRYRPYDTYFTPVKSPEEVVVKSPGKPAGRENLRLAQVVRRTVETRATPQISQPEAMPTNLLYFGENDIITQLRIAGATQADPFHGFFTGARDTHGYAIVREIVSVPTEETDPIGECCASGFTGWPVPGEGQHGVIILDGDARVGLGSRDWNELSVNAWNKLGHDYVTVAPYGHGKIILNDDLWVHDPLAIVAIAGFGEVREEGSLVEGSFERLEFYSEDTHEIRVPTNGELDLSSFGKRTNTEETGAIRQEISLAGKTRLIFEEGSTLRFPGEVDDNVTVVLYLNDESELIFEGAKENGAEPFADVADADGKKVKIIGKGQIWVNKDAKVEVNGAAWVSVRSDSRTPVTDLKISIQRQGSMEIGNDQIAGGVFEVGNPTDLTTVVKGETRVISDSSVSFELKLNGPRATFHIDREGVFGLGAGVVNKEGVMNGTATFAQNPAGFNEETGLWMFNPDNLYAWQMTDLYNIGTIKINLIKGIFDHSNIFRGDDRRASLMAVAGPYNGATVESEKYMFFINDPDFVIIRGGGNMMYLPVASGVTPVNMWEWAGQIIDESVTGVGSGVRYSYESTNSR